MYKILIADDEAMVRFVLRTLVTKHFHEITEIFEAVSGAEAVHIAEKEVPDIVLIDIKMPGMSGIEAAKDIAAKYPHIQIVMITAYDYFEYAREAMRAGAMEYILKPIKQDKIIETVKAAICNIEQWRQKKEDYSLLEEQVLAARPIIERQFAASLLLGDDIATQSQYLSMIKISFEQGIVGIVEMENAFADLNHLSDKLPDEEFTSIASDISAEFDNCIAACPLPRRMIIYIGFKDDTNEFNIKLKITQCADRILEKAAARGICVVAGIGRIYSELSGFTLSCKEAMQAVKHTDAEQRVLFFDEELENGLTVRYPINIEESIYREIQNGCEKESIDALDKIFSWLSLNYTGQLVKIKTVAISISSQISKIIMDLPLANKEAAVLTDFIYYEDIMRLPDTWQIKLYMADICKKAARFICKTRNRRVAQSVQQAVDFIEKNYKREILLNDISAEVLLSPQHLCRIFKKEMNTTISDYLNRTRLARAKELLGQTDMSIKQICFETGFNDFAYFSKVFKKYEDLTPVDYRKNCEYRK